MPATLYLFLAAGSFIANEKSIRLFAMLPEIVVASKTNAVPFNLEKLAL
ncbi:MAG: hypothetical protein WKF59_00190 [Chitinophagaceae bacterium]